ncbi:hypothetical protein SXCC_04550 [Gluconacetobacter sp. SXCC-1]|nr:hypothetical protein SXCC_04550 [Gluconacetobacter sp. SXCC-1]
MGKNVARMPQNGCIRGTTLYRGGAHVAKNTYLKYPAHMTGTRWSKRESMKRSQARVSHSFVVT